MERKMKKSYTHLVVFCLLAIATAHMLFAWRTASAVPPGNQSLATLRREMAEKDIAILRLPNERAAISIEVGKAKREMGMAIIDPSHEQLVMDHVSKMNKGPLPDKSVRKIFREIVVASRNLQLSHAEAIEKKGLPCP